MMSPYFSGIGTDRLIMKKSTREIIKLLICIECLAVFYCCAGIFDLSMINRIDRRTDAMTVALVESTLDPSPMVSKGVEAYEEEQRRIEEENRWKGPYLSKGRGVVYGPSGKETYYNLNMSGVVNIMRNMGYTDEYWVREDGCKMLGDYIMVAANLNLRPRGTIVETSLGKGIVCDTGGFAKKNPYQLDLAVTW